MNLIAGLYQADSGDANNRFKFSSASLASPDGTVILACDARIDNEPAASQPQDAGFDAGFILEAYRRWDIGSPAHLLGDFAFAIWDKQKQRLFCARDPIGVKPFYYIWDGKRFAFASSLKTLLDLPGFKRRINDSMIADYLLFGEFRSMNETFFQGIEQLPPAHACTIEDGRLRTWRYWDPGAIAINEPASLARSLEQFRERFCRAVKRRMRSAAPVGVMLSGGIDSALVTATAETLRQIEPGLAAIHAFTAYYEDMLEEEWDAIKRLQQTFGTSLNRIDWRKAPLFEMYQSTGAIPYYHGLPALPELFSKAGELGCSTLLTGHGGDELIGMADEGLFNQLFQQGNWIGLNREIKSLAWSINGSPKELWLALMRDQLSPGIRRMARLALNRQVPFWLESDFARHIQARDRLAPQPAPMAQQPLGNRASIWALTRPSMVWSLNQLNEITTPLSIECRHPFLDRELIENFLAVPIAIKQQAGRRKLFAQRALEGIMPGPVRKRLYGKPVVEPQDNDPALLIKEAEAIAQALGTSQQAAIYRYVRYESVPPLLDALRAGNLSVRTPLWKFTSLSRWMNQPMNQPLNQLTPA